MLPAIVTSNVWKILCIILGAYILISRRRRRRRQRLEGEYALKIIINTDYKMSQGKVVSQLGHAMSSVMNHLFKNPELFDVWKRSGEPKIVLKATSSEISEVIRLAKKHGIHFHKIHDAGKTQVPPGANTVVALGPALKSTLELVSGHLKLY